MLTVWETIQARRSIRKYAGDDIPGEMIIQMLEAARLAPSTGNSQPWRFIVVREKSVREELCRLRHGQKFIEEAPVVIICFADLNRFSPEARRNKWKELSEWGIADTLSGRLSQPEFWERLASKPGLSREQQLMTAVPDTYIAIEHLLLMATALGLGTCWIGATDDSRLNQLFDLSNNLVSVAVIPVGYPAGPIPTQRPRISLEEMLLKPLPR